MTTFRETLLQRLRDAETAYHRLQTGAAARVIVDQNGERVEFVATTSGRLAAYVQDLKRQLGIIPSGTSGPMQVWL